MPTARAGLTAAAVNGVLYAIGGTFFNTNEAFDPATNTWTTKAPMPTTRETRGTNGPVVNGIVYVIGGTQPGFCTNVNEAYNPATNSWTTLAGMPEARCHLAVAALNGLVYAIGGTNTSGSFLYTTIDVYNPVTNMWSTAAPMPTGRTDLAAAAVNGILYAVGGGNGSVCGLSTLEAYNPHELLDDKGSHADGAIGSPCGCPQWSHLRGRGLSLLLRRTLDR
jgi:N-acetylneuraminic acid mutarotase